MKAESKRRSEVKQPAQASSDPSGVSTCKPSQTSARLGTHDIVEPLLLLTITIPRLTLFPEIQDALRSDIHRRRNRRDGVVSYFGPLLLNPHMGDLKPPLAAPLPTTPSSAGE